MDAAIALTAEFARALGLEPGEVRYEGVATLDSVYPVSDLAAASVGVAALAASRLAGADGPTIRRELVDGWFRGPVAPAEPDAPLPRVWDPLAANYRTRDGWIRLQTNAPAHRAAALRALGLDVLAADDPDARDRVAAVVATRDATELETAVVDAGGAAGELRSASQWAAHPQGRAVAAEPLIHRERTASGRAPRIASGERSLAGIRVLDLTRVLAGPTATQFLAGLGADVLRIDPPDWDEPAALPQVMSGKGSARLDLRAAAGLDRVRGLLAEADVLVHGLRPGALERLGLGEGERRRIRPGLVDVALDAYGWTGPWRERRAFDSVVQLSSGIDDTAMRAAGADAPVALPVQALDLATGYLMAAAVLAGLSRAAADGCGETARLSLARTAVELERARSRVASGELARARVEKTPDLPGCRLATGYGPMIRLDPIVPGLGLAWDLPPRPLGGDRPEWT